MLHHSTCALALLGACSAAVAAAAVGPADFDWDTIKPSRELEYHACYDNGTFQCARLLVPLDWHDDAGTNPHTVALAIAKLPAAVPDADPTFGGTVFTNPGGPGGSGVTFVLRNGRRLRDLVSDAGRRYEILGWDPRGVQFSTPRADCYGGAADLAARRADELLQAAIGPLDAGAGVLGRQYARARGFGELCKGSAEDDAGSILPYLSTPSVVRDMVEMVDRVEELRKREAALSDDLVVNGEASAQQKPLRHHDEAEEAPRIQYWGFSYGSVLGNTFASMYPGRVGRMILDGIVDANDYMTGNWLTNLQDTEKIVSYFYSSCFEAGTSMCALRRSTDTKWEEMKARVDGLVAEADARPISVLRDDDKTTAIITGFEILDVFRPALYSPLTGFRRLAETLSGALEGNYTLLLSTLSSPAAKLSESCTLPNNTVLATRLALDATHAIACGDGEDSTGLTPADWSAYVSELKSQSPTLGAFWSKIRFECSGWSIRPRWRYTGPFGTPAPSSSPFSSPSSPSPSSHHNPPDQHQHHDTHDPHDTARPSGPLLFLTSRLDPVTPARNAHAMASAHVGAAVIVQESAGHCAAASAPSACLRDLVRVYLATGDVPNNSNTNTVVSCAADCEPWMSGPFRHGSDQTDSDSA
ncbi:TAP-like protein-domain-containing protein [Xylariaceae sp. FL0662B]|nr:TAP-like protein-domain-containing protein [Xylariaceae sp. FL0662B]